MRCLSLCVAFVLCQAALLNHSRAEAQGSFEGFDDEFGGVETSSDASATTSTDVSAGEETQVSVESNVETDRSETSQADEQASLFRNHNALVGSVGGLRVVDAGSGKPGTFRLQLHTEFFFASSFLESGDNNEHIGGALSLGLTPLDFLEVYASLKSYANSNDKEDPSLFQVLGDTTIGIKGFYEIFPGLTIGGDLEVAILNAVGDIGVVLDSTSFGIRLNGAFDFRKLADFPLLARLNAQYFFDNSEHLVEDAEAARYSALEDPAPAADENRHLVTRVERFALDINRTDFINLGVGFEAPLMVAEDFSIHPIAEWTWAIPVNRQGYDCLFVRDPADPSRPAGNDDSCLGIEGVASNEMDVTLGVRVLPPVNGLSLFAAIDIGITGTDTFVRELSGNAPYNVMLGIGYAYDPDPPVRIVQQEVEKELAEPVGFVVNGKVIDDKTSAGIEGAEVSFSGAHAARNAIITGSDGSFKTYLFEDGPVDMVIKHPGYETGTCSSSITGADATATCKLTAKPRNGELKGTLKDEKGQPASAEIQISGQKQTSVTPDASGSFSVGDLPAGDYSARVESEDHLVKIETFSIKAQETTNLDLVLKEQSKRPLAKLGDNAITIRRNINFATGSDEINPNSFEILEQVADILLRNPDIRLLEVQGHTDDRGGREMNQKLSEKRALSVRLWLVDHGVDESRVSSNGFGPDQPKVPNITAAGRARNRRVEFIIKERTGDGTSGEQ